MKRLARNTLAAMCRGTGVLARAEAALRHELTILCYHRVLPIERKLRYTIPDLVHWRVV